MRAVVIGQTVASDGLYDLLEEFGFEEEAWVPDTQLLSEFAGRLCYKSWKKPNPATATNRGYIENLKDHKHFSVLEHGSVSFFFDGITRNCTHELVRHRHFSISQVSQRYVNEYNSAQLPPEALHEEELDLFNQVASSAQDAYQMILEMLSARGISGKKARQAARSVLPGSTETAIVVTGNHRSWREFIDKRHSEFADPEIRDLAGLVLAELRSIAPDIYSDFPDKEF